MVDAFFFFLFLFFLMRLSGWILFERGFTAPVLCIQILKDLICIFWLHCTERWFSNRGFLFSQCYASQCAALLMQLKELLGVIPGPITAVDAWSMTLLGPSQTGTTTHLCYQNNNKKKKKKKQPHLIKQHVLQTMRVWNISAKYTKTIPAMRLAPGRKIHNYIMWGDVFQLLHAICCQHQAINQRIKIQSRNLYKTKLKPAFQSVGFHSYCTPKTHSRLKTQQFYHNI